MALKLRKRIIETGPVRCEPTRLQLLPRCWVCKRYIQKGEPTMVRLPSRRRRHEACVPQPDPIERRFRGYYGKMFGVSILISDPPIQISITSHRKRVGLFAIPSGGSPLVMTGEEYRAQFGIIISAVKD